MSGHSGVVMNVNVRIKSGFVEYHYTLEHEDRLRKDNEGWQIR